MVCGSTAIGCPLSSPIIPNNGACTNERPFGNLRAARRQVSDTWSHGALFYLWPYGLDDQDAQGILKRRAEQSSGDGRTDQEQEQTRETSLWQRLETLSVHYQRERLHLESGDLTALVVRTLCYCAIDAINAISANSRETPSDFIITTAQVVQVARAVAKRGDGDPSTNLPIYQPTDFSPTTS